MASRKIQLLRSTTIYNSRELAEASFTSALATAAGLGDGEIALARYRTTDENDNQIIKSVIGIYNNKSNMSGFTIVRDAAEIEGLEDRISELESAVDGLDMSFNIDNTADSNVPQTSDDESKVITSLSQQNGQVYVGETAAKDLLLTGFTKDNSTGSITADDTIEDALNKVENATFDIDGTTIAKNQYNQIYANLLLTEDNFGELPANVLKRYFLAYESGAGTGEYTPLPRSSYIDIYKDSTLKEVYIGTKYDTVDSETGEVRVISYEIRDDYKFFPGERIEDILPYVPYNMTYIYGMYTREYYRIINESITVETYNGYDEEIQSLYYPVIEDNVITGYHVREEYAELTPEEYNNMPGLSSNTYTHQTEPGYKVKDEYVYLTQEEYDELPNQDFARIAYTDFNGSIIGRSHRDLYQSLNFVYILYDGSYQLVKLDVSKFLVENEFGPGLRVDEGVVSVYAGNGLSLGANGILKVLVNPEDDYLSVDENGLSINLDSITQSIDNGLNSVSAGNNGIEVGTKTNKSQTINLKLDDTTTHNQADAQYSGKVETEEIGGETVETVVHNNVLQITDYGLYLDSSWDCGEY